MNTVTTASMANPVLFPGVPAIATAEAEAAEAADAAGLGICLGDVFLGGAAGHMLTADLPDPSVRLPECVRFVRCLVEAMSAVARAPGDRDAVAVPVRASAEASAGPLQCQCYSLTTCVT